MKNIFFMDIDTQRDFMLPEGQLYVAGAERILPKLRRLFDFARKNEITILSSVDAHTEKDTEFQDFPPHCLRGSEGQRKLDETLLPKPLVALPLPCALSPLPRGSGQPVAWPVTGRQAPGYCIPFYYQNLRADHVRN